MVCTISLLTSALFDLSCSIKRDCSGDRRYSDTYPALVWEMHGVIFVFNPENDGHRDQLDYYYDNFIRKSKLSDSNAIVFALANSESNVSTKLTLCKYSIFLHYKIEMGFSIFIFFFQQKILLESHNWKSA